MHQALVPWVLEHEAGVKALRGLLICVDKKIGTWMVEIIMFRQVQ